MREKRNRQIQDSSENKTFDYSLTFKKQPISNYHSTDSIDDKTTFYQGKSKLGQFYSPSKVRLDPYSSPLMQENRLLKQEIKTLKELIFGSGTNSKSQEKLDQMKELKQNQNQQIMKLKKVVEKSYYSIKQMQDQIEKLQEIVSDGNRKYVSLEKKFKIIEFQKEELERKLTKTSFLHKQEIDLCLDKIRKLEVRTKGLFELFEQDQRNWDLQTQQLNSLKKFYFRGTYQ